MSNCCLAPADGVNHVVEHTELIQHCPVCGKRGKGVDTLTVKALLDISLHAVRPSGYGFCRTERCPVVYFSRDGEQTLTEGDLRIPVHQKHPDDDDVYVCYCFRHTPGSIRAELIETGQSTVVETVTRGTQADECACEIRNPQGSCCLGNIRAAVKRVILEPEPVAAGI